MDALAVVLHGSHEDFLLCGHTVNRPGVGVFRYGSLQLKHLLQHQGLSFLALSSAGLTMGSVSKCRASGTATDASCADKGFDLSCWTWHTRAES